VRKGSSSSNSQNFSKDKNKLSGAAVFDKFTQLKLSDGKEAEVELLSTFMTDGSNSNSHSKHADKEIMYRITWYDNPVFADAVTTPEPLPANNVFNVNWNLAQDFTAENDPNSISGQGELLCRPHTLKVYAYPRSVNASNVENIYAVLTSVPVCNEQNGSATTWFNSNQQTTVIPPTFNPHWIEVADINYTKLFADAQIRPAVTFSDLQRLIQLGVVNSSTLRPIYGQKFAFKFVLTCHQTVPVTTRFNGQIGYTSSFAQASESVSGDAPLNIPALIEPIKMTQAT